MNRQRDIWDKKKMIAFLLGFIGISITCVPYLLLGAKSVIMYHDQLDVEVLCYIYQAKYLFSGENIIPEMMNGIFKSGMSPPAPLAVLFYKVMPPLSAYIFNQYIVCICAFIGMFLCVYEVLKDEKIALLTAGIYALIPLHSVHGLSILGQPLLIFAFYGLYKNKHKIGNLLIIAFVTGMSSLALGGYYFVGFACLFELYMIYKKEFFEKKYVAVGIFVMTVLYCAMDKDLLLQVIGVLDNVVVHREEFVMHSLPMLETFLDTMIVGGQHARDYHIPIFVVSTIFVILGIVGRKRIKEELKLYYRLLFVFYSLNTAFALFQVFWYSEMIIALRNDVGGIFKYFQLNRFYWASPTLWYFILAICAYIIIHGVWGFEDVAKPSLTLHQEKRVKTVGIVAAFLVFASTGIIVLKYSAFNYNMQKLVYGESYEAMTWGDFYAEDVFEEIDAFIGEPKENYGVASLGIYPAAALYNGFYCIDGYSNNYPLSYKQEFRKLIAGEIEKSEAIRVYFDEWGSRCYLLSAEIGMDNFKISKKSGVVVEDFTLDTEQFVNMGGKYIFSAVPIMNAGQLGLTLAREEPFETEDSYYRIYLYEALLE